MPGLLMDLETGDPYIDPDLGQTVIVDDERAFVQIVYGIFNCTPGSELLNIYYGFDLAMAVRVSHFEDAEMYVQSLIAEALDPRKEKLISNVNFIDVQRDDTIPGRMNATVDINSITGDNVQLSEAIGEEAI